MYRFIVNSSRLGGLYRRNCDHCQRQSLAVQCSRYFSQDSNKTEQSTQSADRNAKVASENAELAEEQVAVKLSGFAKSYEEMTAISTNIDKPIKDTTSFRELFRASNFVDLGDPFEKVVEGTIYHTVNDDLYIDFGWKFHCVCPRPHKGGDLYVNGAKVKLSIKKLELSARFLGEQQTITLLEADCKLLSLISSPVKQERRSRTN